MGYKILQGSPRHVKDSPRHFKDSPRDAIDDSRVYDHYDYAFDEFETYDNDDFESEEACCREADGERPQISNKLVLDRSSKNVQINPRWEKLKSQDTLREHSKNWFSQAPFNMEPEKNTMQWKFTQTDPETCSTSRPTQTHQVAQVTVASMVPNDLTIPTPTIVFPSHSKLYSTFKSARTEEIQLKSFLTYAAYVLESLMARPTEQVFTKFSHVVIGDHSSGLLTDGSVALIDTLPDDLLNGRLVQFVSFEESSRTKLLCGYGPASSSSGNTHSHQGCICIYDILSNPSLQFILFVQGVPTCASWSVNTRRSNWGLIVAGTEDGTLALWDLSSKPVGTTYPTSLLHPTYSTSYRIEENHTAPIVSILLDGNSMGEVAIGSLAAGMSGNFLKLISLDKLGFVYMWIVKEVQLETAGDDELGLHPDGRLCLVRTGTTSVFKSALAADALEIMMPEACAFANIPGRVQEILVALSDGTLVKTSLVGSRPSAPRRFIRQALKGSEPVASSITSLCFSPFVEDCFLVAYADNAMAIFTLDKPYPWGIWTLPSTESDGHIISVQWSPLESTVVLVAVSSRKVHVFDISCGLVNPIFSETLDLSHDIVWLELSKREAGASKNANTEYSFVTASLTGDIKIHLLKHTSNDYHAEGLKHLLLKPSFMIS